MASRYNEDHTEVFLTWSQLKDHYINFVNKKNGLQTWKSQPTMERMRNGSEWRDEWTGNTPEEMLEFLKNGYHPDELAYIDAYTPKVKKRKQFAAEEGGEVMFDRAWSGDPMPFIEWEERPSRPGLRIVADCAFHCGTPASVIGEFGAWIAGLIRGLETQGYDLELDILYSLSGAFEGEYGGPNEGPFTDVNVRVTDEGEWSDFTEFSAVFAPGGLRTLGFTAIGMAGDEVGKTLNSHIGYPNGSKWAAEFDEVTRTLTIVTRNGDNKFPGEMLTKQVREAGLIK